MPNRNAGKSGNSAGQNTIWLPPKIKAGVLILCLGEFGGKLAFRPHINAIALQCPELGAAERCSCSRSKTGD